MAMTTEQAEHYTLKLQGYSRSELVNMLVQTEREHQARGDELDEARAAFLGMADTCAATIEERDTARAERDDARAAIMGAVDLCRQRIAQGPAVATVPEILAALTQVQR